MEKYIYIDETGIHGATFEEILKDEKEKFKSIYGDDVYLGNDSFDGQWITINAYAKYQTVNAIINTYSQFAPSSATGERLSSLVKINGIARHKASKSTVDITITGTAGTIINNGVVSDSINQWKLPTVLVIPFSGEMIASAECANDGAIQALPNTINQIITPTRGWQTANNLSAASVGSKIETDAQLRKRQINSTANPSRSIVKGILGSVQDIIDVSRARIYENDTNLPDHNNLPPHSIALVVEGGDPTEIANTISLKKGPGCYTHGDIVVSVNNIYGVPMDIRFFRPIIERIKYQIHIKPLVGFSEDIKKNIVNEIINLTNDLEIGGSIIYTKMFVPLNLNNSALGNTFEIQEFLMGADGNQLGRKDIKLSFNGSAVCSIDDVEVIIR